MSKVVLMLSCLTGRAYVGSTQATVDALQGSPIGQAALPADAAEILSSPSKVLAMLALALNPTSAFNPSGLHSPLLNPTLAGTRRVGATPLAVAKTKGKLATKSSLLKTKGGPATRNKFGIQASKHLGDKPKKHKTSTPPVTFLKAAEKGPVEFLGGFRIPKEMPKSKMPEVTFAGRSNVGKSSALNQLLCRPKKKVALVSNTPGRTRLINLFKLDKVCHLTDLPGYGFAKISEEAKERWKSGVTAYLRYRENLKCVVQLVDAQRDPNPMDAQLLDFLQEFEIPVIVLATKIDKVKPKDRQKKLDWLSKSLALPKGQPIPFSGVTGEGKKEAWRVITDVCYNRTGEIHWRLKPKAKPKAETEDLFQDYEDLHGDHKPLMHPGMHGDYDDVIDGDGELPRMFDPNEFQSQMQGGFEDLDEDYDDVIDGDGELPRMFDPDEFQSQMQGGYEDLDEDYDDLIDEGDRLPRNYVPIDPDEFQPQGRMEEGNRDLHEDYDDLLDGVDGLPGNFVPIDPDGFQPKGRIKKESRDLHEDYDDLLDGEDGLPRNYVPIDPD